jgi:hypothetical protein
MGEGSDGGDEISLRESSWNCLDRNFQNLLRTLTNPWSIKHQISIPIKRRTRCKSLMKLGKVARLLNMRLRKPFPGTLNFFFAFSPSAHSLFTLAIYSIFEIRQMHWHASLKTYKKRVIDTLSVILVIANNNSSNFQVENINDLASALACSHSIETWNSRLEA